MSIIIRGGSGVITMTYPTRWTVVCEICKKALMTTPRIAEEQTIALREHIIREHPEERLPPETSFGDLLRRFRCVQLED